MLSTAKPVYHAFGLNIRSWRKELTAKQVERVVNDHGRVMRRFGYPDTNGEGDLK